jgi:hypothetical protein
MDEMTMLRAVLGTAPEPSARVRAQARASLERRLGCHDAAPRRRVRTAGRPALIAVVSAAAAAAAAAAVIATVPGRPAGHHTSAGLAVETAAYVLKRAAAAQADAFHLIGVERIPDTGFLYDGTTYADAATRQLHWVSYRRTPGGLPLLEESVSASGYVYVDYRDRVYFGCMAGVGAGCAATPDTSVTQYALPFLGPQRGNGWQDPAATYNAALAAGEVTVVGHRNLHGQDTILLLIRQTARRIPQPPQTQVWVDARTYLVVQETVWGPDIPNGATVDPAARVTLVPRTTRVSWLQPTPANLAKLNLSRPLAGFSQVNDHQLAHYLGIYG